MIDYEELQKEYIKCVSDKSRIYMITHFLKTYDATQKKNVAFKLFPRQQDLCRTLGNANNVVTTKPRQAGITTTTGGFISCEMALADPKSPQTALVIGNTIDLAQQMVTKIRDFLLQFPAWIWGDDMIELVGNPLGLPTKKQLFYICNTKELVLKNGCRVVARSSGPHASRGVGGCTWLIFDEAAFIEDGVEVYSSALPTISTGGHIVMISTPHGKDPLYYETCRRAELKGTKDWNNFEIVKLKWFQDPRYNKHLEWTRKNSKTGEIEVYKEELIDKEGNVRYDEVHWEEMEKDGWAPRSPWYLKMCREFNNDEQKIAQELDVSFLGSASNVVAPEYIEMQSKLNVREPILVDNIVEDTWIWKEPIPGHRYLCAVDNSRGDSNDRTAIEILDMDGVDEDGTPIIEQVLEYHGKKTGDDVGEMVFQYANLYNQAFVVVECIGGSGDATILTLQRLGYENLYYDDPTLKTFTIQREYSSIPVTNDERLPGFHSSSVRFQMLTNFANLVKTNQFKIRSKRVIQELETWIYKGSAGRIDHMEGCHDDTLTCLAMGLFVMQFSLNKMEAGRARNIAMLRAWTTTFTEYKKDGNTPKHIPAMPFYTTESANKANPYGAYMWLLK